MDVFSHIKTVMGIIMGLGLTHILKGVTKIIEHPAKAKPYWVHLLWCLYLFLLINHFWWFEINLATVRHWNFSTYFFLVFYVTLYYLLCAMIFPDDMKEYYGFEDYFFSRKKWFFTVLAFVFAADYIDTAIKGKVYMAHLHWEYPVRNITHIGLCIGGAFVRSKIFHAALVITLLLYEISWIVRLYFVE